MHSAKFSTLAGTASAGGVGWAGDTPYVLAHLSDPHLTSLEGVRPRDLLSKRVLGYLSWRLHRRHEHRGEVLSALVADLHAMGPHHIAVTGDLTHIGLPAEFRQARGWLDALAPPHDLTVIPGNHEAYAGEQWRSSLELWAPYMRSDAARGEAFYPILRARGPLALIGLSSACPSAPFLATGRLGREQLAALHEVLKENAALGLVRVVLVHHPAIRGTVRWRKRLTDGANLESILGRIGAELVLHGHAHRAVVRELGTSRGAAPVIGVPSASGIGLRPGRRAEYNLYRFERGSRGWSMRAIRRGYSLEQEAFVPVGERVFALPSLGRTGA